MKEIKFRSWIKDKKEMLYEFTLKQPTVSNCKKNILMQYTGLKDKNGREIYEGDIVTHLNEKYEITTNPFTQEFVVDSDTGQERLGVLNNQVEVIGNIYEDHTLGN
ncbi:YopX family protein [Bacillus atrophaeus]|uniref:YopX family protein n=1 Tax=Bacillus atrophaeus TaxID=1452 RepID=UPI0022803DB5|nr:YopX family protein [Bacillus atrophaeus]MCY8837585.1 YopX family protein [Bacillus atrophaeus]